MTARRRCIRAAAGAAAAVVVAACGPAADAPPGLAASPLPTATGAGPTDTTTAAPVTPPPATGSTPPASVAPTTGTGGGGATRDDRASPDQAPPLTAISDRGPVGSNGPAYLRGDRSRLVVEVDTQGGVSLTDAQLAHVVDVLGRESNASVELVEGVATTTDRDSWDPGSLVEAATATRDVAQGDDVAVLHLLVLGGGYRDDGALGVAFDASSAAVFPEEWSGLTGVLSGGTIGRAVTTHEVGHLLGLVGLGGPTTSDHEDPEHPGHTSDEDDVMYFAVETTLIADLSGIPDDFGPRTRADLAAMRDR